MPSTVKVEELKAPERAELAKNRPVTPATTKGNLCMETAAEKEMKPRTSKKTGAQKELIPKKLKNRAARKPPTVPPRLSAEACWSTGILKLIRQRNRKRPETKETIPVTSCLVVGDLFFPGI